MSFFLGYQGEQRPTISHLSSMKLGNENFELLSQISASYQVLTVLLQLEQEKIDVFKLLDDKTRITIVLMDWIQKGSGGYPVTWQGLWDLLDDIDLRNIGNNFFNFLERHEK